MEGGGQDEPPRLLPAVYVCIHEGPAQLLGGLRLPRERRHANVLL